MWKKLGQVLAVLMVLVPLFAFSSTVKAATPVYRVYNPNSGAHHYTTSFGEASHLYRVGWNFEDIAWYAPDTGVNLYRVYNPNAGDHHYTVNSHERDYLVRVGWRDEGVSSLSGGSIPVYRLYNPNAKVGSHHYTTNGAERAMLIKVGWRDEGIGWYAEAYGGISSLRPARPVQPVRPISNHSGSAYYANCTEVWNHLGRPIKSSDLGYSRDLDKDGDGTGCESRPR